MAIEARAQKITRAIGITCHADPATLQAALERHDFDCTQMALNAGLASMADAPGGMKTAPAGANSLERLAISRPCPRGNGGVSPNQSKPAPNGPWCGSSKITRTSEPDDSRELSKVLFLRARRS